MPKFLKSMVNQALESVQKEFTLCARDPKRDLKVPAKTYPWVTTSGLAVFVNDYDTGEYRDSTRKDIAAFTRLGDAVDSAKGISFEQLIIDSYTWDCCKNYLHEVEI